MEPPVSLAADAIRDEKVKVLRSLRLPGPSDVARGRYAAGMVGGEAVRAYADEAGVAADSRTETFVAMRLHIDNWRWDGVPFYIRSGKRMSTRVTEVTVQLKGAPRCCSRGSTAPR